jgi:hypothetical protein
LKAVLKGINRPLGVYIAGNPGYGKSSLIQQMALADIKAGRGVCVIDPTSDLVSRLIHWIPRDRVKDTIYFDTDNPTPIDFFSYRSQADRDVLLDQLTAIFALDNAPISQPKTMQIIGTLFDANKRGGQFSFYDIYRFIKSKDVREKAFELAPHRREDFAGDPFSHADYKSITGRLIKFKENPALLAIMDAKPNTGINIWDVMQSRKILLINLKDTPTDLFIGSLIVSKIQQATFARRYILESQRIPYYLYIDECQTVMKYAAPEFEQILTRARKYNLCLTLANQIPSDLPLGIKQKIGTVGAIILFNLDTEDARIFKNRMLPHSTEALYDLNKFVALTRINGKVNLVKTPLFLGPSHASYAKSIRKRIGDNPPLHTADNPHTDGNGSTDPRSENVRRGPAPTNKTLRD